MGFALAGGEAATSAAGNREETEEDEQEDKLLEFEKSGCNTFATPSHCGSPVAGEGNWEAALDAGR